MASEMKDVSLGSCPVCGRAALNKYSGGKLSGFEGPSSLTLKDGTHLCGSCVRRLRVMYPLNCHFNEAKRELETADPLRELTSEEALEANGQIVSYRESLRESYGFHNAVFVVDAMAESKEGLLQAPLVSFFGQVLYGSFFMLEEVTILSGGKETKAQVVAIDEYKFRIPLSGLKDWMRNTDPGVHVGENGYPCRLVVQAKGISAQPGDLIVKD